MPSRMDKYNSKTEDINSRTDKNQQLYKELYSNKTYTEFTDSVKDNVVDLTSSNNDSRKRSDTNKAKLYYDMITGSNLNKNSSKQINNGYRSIIDSDLENKNYDINDVIEDAKKNRKEENEQEKQKKIKSAEYSILSDLSKEKIKEYHEKKEKGITKEEEDNLEELINTITSNSLRKKIDDQLLADLLPEDNEKTSTSLLEELADGLPNDIDDDTREQSTNTDEFSTTGIDKSFFTRSMDLKKEDLISDSDDEYDDSFQEKTSIVKKVLIILVILLVLATIGFLIYKML